MMTLGAMALPGTEGVALVPSLRCGCLQPSGMNPTTADAEPTVGAGGGHPDTSGRGNWRWRRTPGPCAHGASGGNRTGLL